MKNIKFPYKSLIVLVFFGFTVVSCSSKVDTNLNGTWVTDGSLFKIEYKFNNGNFEATISMEDGDIKSKGTYTTDNGVLTVNAKQMFSTVADMLQQLHLESKWYTINEIIIAFRPFLEGYRLSEAEINQMISNMISPPGGAYSVDGKSLIVTTTMNGMTSSVIYLKK